MKVSHVLYGKKFLPLLIFLIIVPSLLCLLSVNIKVVSADDYSIIYIEPALTDTGLTNTTLMPGTNFTISIKTNYTGTDIWGWQFNLSYNPLVLHGGIQKTETWMGDNATKMFNTTETPVVPDSEEIYVNGSLIIRDVDYTMDYTGGHITFSTAPDVVTINATYLYGVVNGDLITKAIDSSATFILGTFDNTEGKLTHTSAVFTKKDPPIPVTNGPGTLANVTFTVIGFGATNITLGSDTALDGWLDVWDTDAWYRIIDGKIRPDRLQHSKLVNVYSNHTVGISRIAAQSQVVIERIANITVTVVNSGNFTETGNMTLYYNTTELGTGNFTLNRGLFKPFSFNWNTSGFAEGFYILNATTTMSGTDEYPTDNTKTALIELKKVPDVAVTNISAPTQADMGEPIAINVTIVNNGSFDESVNVTLIFGQWNEVAHRLMDPTFIGSQVKNISIRDSVVVPFNWNASGINPRPTYTLNATATISGREDGYPSDNTKTANIKLILAYDVTIISLQATYPLFVEQSASINVTVMNTGLNPADSVNVTLSYKSVLINPTFIGSQVKNISKGGSVVVPFSWNTSGVDPGSYTLTARARLSGDGDLSNNNRTAIIYVSGAHITGVVTDALTEDPIENASIIVGDYQAITDINGTYNITDVLPGIYDVAVSATGYENDSQLDITVIAEAEPTTVNFALRAISNLTISADPATIKVGQSIAINASLSPIRINVNITILYKLSGEEAWTELANVTANESGQFVYVWTPETAGTYEIKAEWLGDEKTSPAENSVQVTVEEVPSDIFLYLAIGAAVAGVSGLAIAVYLLKVRKPT